ncbi:MAG: hypothetical protein ACOVJ7_02920 [Candidatus Methylopumilus universalis]
MKLSLYKSLLTGRRTMFVASQGKCGHAGYVEYQVIFSQGQWLCYKTDGYSLDLIKTYPGSKGLKSVLNLIWNIGIAETYRGKLK